VLQNLYHKLLIKGAGRYVLMALLMLGVLVNALIPLGFMPDTIGGKIAIVICSGMGDKIVLVDSKDFTADDKQSSKSPHDESSTCPYSLAQSVGVHPEHSLVSGAVPLKIVLLPASYKGPASQQYLFLQPVRGPPSDLV
jgi:Protein of unknown function (DUF2946)